MPVLEFPDPRQSTEEGIVAVGGDLHPDSLRLAYRKGIFPWPIEGLPLTWFCPPSRAVLFFREIHVPRSLEKQAKRGALSFTCDRAFDRVIAACADTPRPGQPGTWITPAMERAYLALHRQGDAHSVEAWMGDELVGGIYGVDAGGAFAAESMFYREPNASKLALLELCRRLEARGLEWLDIQVMTPHMQRLGAREITRDEFLDLLSRTLARGLKLFP